MITIKEYVDRMFRNLPVNEKTESMKWEIIQDLQEKVKDLMDGGKTEEDAVNKAIVDFGDFDEIRQELSEEPVQAQVQYRKPETAEQKYRKISNAFLFSLFGSALIVGLMIFINFYYSPRTIWFVYPLFGIIWWPLALFFTWLNRRSKR